MNKKTLSIGIIVCDKDFQYLESLLERIKDKVTGNYSIIIYNNCIENYDKLQNLKTDAVILPNTYKTLNSRQVYARKMITEEAYRQKTDYIWFVDADDDVYAFNINKLKLKSDIILFQVGTIAEDGIFYKFDFSIAFPKNRTIHRLKKTYEYADNIGKPLWCKFVKTSIYKQVYDLIDAENLPPISCSEDTLASMLCMKFAKNCYKLNKMLYFQNRRLSNSNGFSVDFNDIKQCTIGIGEVFKLLDTLFTEEEKVQLNIQKLKSETVKWVLWRIIKIEDIDERFKAFDYLNDCLGDTYKKVFYLDIVDYMTK